MKDILAAPAAIIIVATLMFIYGPIYIVGSLLIFLAKKIEKGLDYLADWHTHATKDRNEW